MSKQKAKTTKFVSMNLKDGPKSLAEDQQNLEDNNRYYLDVDPDLPTDVEIELPKDHRAVSRATMSGKSRKTMQSERQSENREHIVRSRGRPIKPHETEPFLSINTLPPEKSFVSEKSTMASNAAHSRGSKPMQHMADESRSLEAQLHRMSTYMSPYHQQTPVPPSPSVVTGHIYTKSTQPASRPRTSPCKSPGSRPSSKTKQPLTPKQTVETNTPELNGIETGCKETSNEGGITVEMSSNSENPNNKISPVLETLKEDKIIVNSSSPDVLENKKKHARPSTAPASSQTGSVAPSKKPRPGSEKSRSTSAKQMSRTNTSMRSRASSAGSRSGAGSRAGYNAMGFRSRARSRSRSRSRSRKASAGNGSVPSRTGRITPANTPYNSPNKTLRAPNHHVKSPFKHAVNQPDFGLDGRQTPSMGMKERTALAAFHVHKMLSVAGEKDVHKVTGKLQKGKLRPLYPVSVEGPTIEKCRGIVSETRAYQASPSRTLQRRVNLMNKIPNVHEYLYERPQTVESVHQTSVASSIDEDYDRCPDSDRSLPDEILYAQGQSIIEPKTPENTFMPEPTQDEIVNGIEMMGMDATPRMFATEVGSQEPVAVNAVTVSNTVQQELHLNDSAAAVLEINDLTTENKNNNNELATKTEADEQPVLIEEKTRIGSPSKSVRFAEQKENGTDSQNSKEVKQMVNENIAKQQKNEQSKEVNNLADLVNGDDIDANVIETVSRKNKLNSKGSCKSEGVDTIFRKDDDDDEEEGYGKNDNRKNNDNGNQNNSSGNLNQTKDTDNKGNGSGNSKNSGQKRPLSATHTRSRSASGSRRTSRSKNQTDKNSGKESQLRKCYSGSASTTRSSSKGSHCSRFEQSKASIAHTQTLEVSSVIHGGAIATVIGPESPKRGRSRSTSPKRSRDQTFQFFSHASKPCFEDVDEFSSLHGNTHRSKVKFMLEGEEPEVETIFMEDENNIDIRPDKEITYDVLDSEIEMLRSAIHTALVNDTAEIEADEIESGESVCDRINDEDAKSDDGSDSDTIITETETVETIRGDYSNLIEKYRQRCMDRSENYGAISAMLVTPRDTQNSTSGRSRSLGSERNRRPSFSKGNKCGEPSTGDDKTDEDTKALNCTILSDSGHGSVDDLSEFSHSTSQGKTDVPKLDLGGSTSDLGLESGRSDVTSSTRNEKENDGEEEGGKTLLELVCDQLSPVEQRKKPAKRRELIRQIMLKHRLQREEDVSNLKIVATTKSLSKNRKPKGAQSGAVQAPFPPVCFTINARPPKGYLFYFAYGPDMNPNRFSSYIQRNSQDRYWGLLFGFNLVFNKKGTSEEAGGFANLEFNPLRSVEGCIYKITPQELEVLDKCVGYPQHYEHLVLPVWLSNSVDPDNLGVAQYCVPALTYIAQNSWTETDKTLNCDYALSQCIKSADVVTTAYKESLVARATPQEVTASA